MSGNKGPIETMDLTRLHMKTIESVRHLVDNSPMPCVGFSLVFLEHEGNDEGTFKFQTRILGEPHKDMGDQERKDLKLAFEFLAAGVKKIMDGEFRETEQNDFTVSGDFRH